MKKVINGARYDTDTAKRVGAWESDCDCTCQTYRKETLYRTKAGKWFLHGSGNESSVYAGRKPDGWPCPGEQIIPLPEETARRWVEQHLTHDDAERIFGALDAEITHVAAYLPADVLKNLDAEKVRSGRSRSSIIIDALRKYL